MGDSVNPRRSISSFLEDRILCCRSSTGPVPPAKEFRSHLKLEELTYKLSCFLSAVRGDRCIRYLFAKVRENPFG